MHEKATRILAEELFGTVVRLGQRFIESLSGDEQPLSARVEELPLVKEILKQNVALFE